jgi:hypothetical protein
MRIVLQTTATPPAEYVLAEGTASRKAGVHIGPDGFEKLTQMASQVVRPIRSTAGAAYNRGGRISVVSFSVVVEFASIREAEAYALVYEGSIAMSGTLVMTAREGLGAPTIRTMANASLDAIRTRVVGRSVVISYTISGGLIQ